MTGPLTNSLTNARNSLAQVTAIQNLPPQAAQVQQVVASSLNPLFSAVPTFQNNLIAYLTPQQSALENIATELSQGATSQSVAPILSDIAHNMLAFQSQANSLLTSATAATSQLTASFTTLSNVEGTLQGQISALQAQIGSAQGELDAARKRYYYLLALGPFGLVGLAVALALYLKWKGNVSDLQNQISSLNAQIQPIQNMISSCQSLATVESQLLQSITSLKNAIDAVGSDFSEILTDLQSNTNPIVLELTVRAAHSTVTILISDAS